MALALGCRAQENRAALADPAANEVAALLRGCWHRPGDVQVTLLTVEEGARRSDSDRLDLGPKRAVADLDGPSGSHEIDLLFDDGPLQADVGLPVTVNFGVGEAPYDDGTLPIHRGCVGPGGFSDSILSVVWQQPLPGRVAFEGRAAMVRDQDRTIFESLSDAHFAFAVLGFSVSF
ncbi:MAG: hypothetical protein R3F49_21490 [Planctomycetota bacterium]